MSLTSELRTSGSPIRDFLQSHFPKYRPIQAEARKVLTGVATIRPAMDLPYGTIGTALDYRIRYYFAITPSQHLAAWQGARLASGMLGLRWRSQSIPWGVVRQLFAQLERELRQLQPVGKALHRADEERLARYCVVLALFEELYRAGGWIGGPLASIRANAQVDDLLALAEQHWLDDLCELSNSFFKEWAGWLSRPAILNPTFEGSEDILGADADLIVDGRLIEIKTSLMPRIKAEWLWQLLGYLLLDYRDRYQIREVSVYLARQRTTIGWPVQTLLQTMAGADAPSLEELRARFEQIVSHNWLMWARRWFNSAADSRRLYRLLAYTLLDPGERQWVRDVTAHRWGQAVKATDLMEVLLGDATLRDRIVRPAFRRLALQAATGAPTARSSKSERGQDASGGNKAIVP